VGVFNVVYVYGVCLKCFKTNYVQIHESTTPLLSIFSLKLQWTRNTVWNRWCFWRQKLPCNQSDQRVIVKEWISELSEWRRGSRTTYTKWGKGVELHSIYFNNMKKKKFKYAILLIKDTIIDHRRTL